MTTVDIKKDRFNQLGLPPMELAEPSTNSRNNNGFISRFLLPSLLKMIAILLIIIFGAGSFILLSRMVSNYDCAGKTKIIIIKENNENPPETKLLKTIHSLNISEEKDISRKRRAINPIPDNYLDMKEFNSLNLNDDQIQRAREIIMKHDILCNENNEQEICKDLVTKLQSISKNNDNMSSENSNLNSVEELNENLEELTTPKIVDKHEELRTANLYNNKETKPINQFSLPHSDNGPNNCLMTFFENYHKNILNPSPQFFTSPRGRKDALPTSNNRLFSFTEDNSHVRDDDSPGKQMHPQDVDILLSFLTPKLDAASTGHQVNTNDISCPHNTVPCLNGVACVDKKQWCDGHVDCDDISDEARCNCKSRVDKSRLCDGYFDCPFGEDEMGCNGCSENTFSCDDKDSHSTCFTKDQRCNKVVDCPNHKDEVECIMLSPTLLKKPIFAISNTEGFLHRNFKGEWYAVCKNPYMWAHDVCRSETGLIIRPPHIELIAIDPMLKINYISNDHGGLLETSDGCYNSSAVYVTCPKLLCGTRIKPTSQLLRENIAVENHLFGRNKRFYESNYRYPLMFYPNRWKRNVGNAISMTNHENKFDTAKIEDDFGKMRNKRTEVRVVGGIPSQPAAWPWVVALYRNGIFHCGGVIITHSWVISAAHCVNKFWDHYYEIQVGMLRRFSFSPQEQSYKVTHIIVNQHYSQTDMKNDLSLLKVDPEIQFSRWVRPICLPSPDVAGQDWLWGPAPGTICTAVGWGATMEHGPDPDHLREVELPIWDKCKHTEDLAGNEICAGFLKGGKDACQGDSGGPLLCKNPLNSQQWYLAGIVSHGDGCGREDEPGVYTRVSLFIQWIRHHVSSNSLPRIKPIHRCPGFKCESGISKCLPNSRKCDKIVDCLDGEDEVNCEYSRKMATFDDNNLSQNDPSVEDIFVAKDVKEPLSKNNELDKIHDTTPINIETSSNKVDATETTQDTLDTKSTDGNIDFQHASTFEISISKSNEYFNEFENQVTENTFIKIKNDTDEIFESSTTTFAGELVELRSISEKSSEETTEKNSATNEIIENKTSITEQSTTTETERLDIVETTTHVNSNENNQVDLTATQSALETEQGFIVHLLPPSNLSIFHKIPQKTSPNQMEKLILNNNKSDKSKTKPLLNLVDKSKLLSSIEDMVSSEIQPATVRRRPRLPDNFQCQRIYQIIPYHQRCNRKADCEDGTDELECSCIDYLITFDKDLVCDGHFDCADGRDETDCFSCEDTKFLCKQSQICLPLKNVCDGVAQCPYNEDEHDCYALTNGKDIYYDVDERPIVNLEGFVTKKHNNDWHVVCDNQLTPEQQEKYASYICRYLGFGSANKYQVKYVKRKEAEVKKRSIEYKRNLVEHVPVHFIYKEEKGVNETFKEVVIEDPQVIREECVPNITKTCKSLYVFCDHSLYDNLEEFDNKFLRKTENTQDRVWPWVAKVFIEGEYRCIGVLVNLSWVIVSDSCLWDATLTHSYITVVLGSHRTLDTVNGMYEQSYAVDFKKNIYHSKIILLHLKNPAYYSNFVKPMVVSSSYTDFDANSTCIAIGQDNKNKTISIFVQETFENCHQSNRCFIRKSKDNICPVNTVSNQHWAGIISCHTEQGWFPAASFDDSRGECGIGDRINATYINDVKYELKYLKNMKSQPDLNKTDEMDNNCEGIRCARGRCIPLRNLCDGVRNCEDGNDESETACKKKKSLCSQDPYNNGCECSVGQLKCRNGKCISKELFRDGNDDCGDRTDEPGQSACSHYLARVMPSRLCDGILHCHDRSDEDPMFCKCFAKKSFKCGTKQNADYCVAVDMVCDGILDCPNGEDEKTCNGLLPIPGTPRGTGQVIIQSHGVWYSKCYPKQNHTRTELESICAELGFISGHAKQIYVTKEPTLHNNLVIDKFIDVVLNNSTKIKMRNSANPIAETVFDEHMENCYPVYIECL